MCLVSDIFVQADSLTSVQWSWKREPGSDVELREMQELMEIIRYVSLNKCINDWRWEGDTTGCFTVAAVRRWLVENNAEGGDIVLDWYKWIPDKCNIFMWRALLDRLPTKTTLSRTDIHMENTLCAFCEDGEETVVHVFTGCGFSMGVWDAILRWCGIPNFFAFSLKYVMDMPKINGLSPVRKEIIRGEVSYNLLLEDLESKK
ncbi:uncharacterized protein LOC110913948 [Helianthus annuus]|uniref:uncharacterized protein LOC110913948 n=1 Tax=Helianthus annuus TaxID=4232 RepID=UPI000B908C8B|nr:uncharacterized protein LOC110913948 [Helianthus annuus]